MTLEVKTRREKNDERESFWFLLAFVLEPSTSKEPLGAKKTPR